MSISKYKKAKNKKIKIKAVRLYKEGLSYRQVGILVGMSYAWVRDAVKEDERINTKLDKIK